MRTFLIKFLNILLAVGVLVCYQGYAVKRQQKVNAYEKKLAAYKRAESAAKNHWTDGIYEGGGNGYGGEVKVQVTIENHSIKSIKILSAKGETPEYLESAKKILDEIVTAQSADVDMVTGATLSSAGIILGVNEALQKSETAK